MKPGRLAVHQLRYEQVAYWRNPQAAFFTFLFPILFLVIFASLNSGTTISFLGGMSYNQYYIPGITSFGVMSACYTNLAVTLAFRREQGILKRLRATPLPASSLIGGMLLNALVVTVILVVLTSAVGIGFYGVTFPRHWAALALALLTGSVCFCALGVAVSALVPNEDAAPAIVNGVFFPVVFLSGIFFPLHPHSGLSRVADVFPVHHFAQAMFAAFDPRIPHGALEGIAWHDLAALGAWALAAVVVAIRRFRWEPRRG